MWESRKCQYSFTDIDNLPDEEDTDDDEDEEDESSPSSSRVEIPLDSAVDYSLSFCGHCNTTTDIKEATFLGGDAQFVAAGSDDGKFFIWEKASTNIVRIFEGDESIVNCLQGHPTACLLATSGIDPVVRLWSPFAEVSFCFPFNLLFPLVQLQFGFRNFGGRKVVGNWENTLDMALDY